MAKITYKGKFESYDDLPVADLPENAVQYEEVDGIEEIAKVGSLIGLIPFSIELILVIIKHGFVLEDLLTVIAIASIIYLVSLVPHELIHGAMFPKGSEVEFYQAIRKGVLFVTCTDPISKSRFIWMSLMPNIIFCLIPFIIFLILPVSTVTGVIAVFSMYSALSSGGDLYNVYNTLRQVPKDAYVVMSGIHTYYYC